MQETILILDFGSQYTQLIARRVRELNVYCEIHPFNKIPVSNHWVKGVILSGSPYSVRDDGAPFPDVANIRHKMPILGICYGAQYLAQSSGGVVAPSKIREYGRATLSSMDENSELLHGMTLGTQVWMSHADTILSAPENFKVIASTSDVLYAGFRVKGEDTYGIQFHPEVYHTTEGLKLLRNFVVEGLMSSAQKTTTAKLKRLFDQLVVSLYALNSGRAEADDVLDSLALNSVG